MSKPEWKEVSHEEFTVFVNAYPRPLAGDVCGMSEPPLVAYYDFDVAEGWDAMVAKFHKYEDVNKRVYRVSEHLL